MSRAAVPLLLLLVAAVPVPVRCVEEDALDRIDSIMIYGEERELSPNDKIAIFRSKVRDRAKEAVISANILHLPQTIIK